MLTYAAALQAWLKKVVIPFYPDILTYPDVRWRMLTCADVS
jgi:hypothetical protein